jgi:hypothetical protein
MGKGKQQEKQAVDHETLLYHLARIVRELHPNQLSHNPYDIGMIKHSMSVEDQLLFKDLLHAITLLNAPSRNTRKEAIISSPSDFINAMQLVIPKELLIDIKCINAHQKLLDSFGKNPFSYVDGARCLKMSRPSFIRRLRPLLLQGMIIKLEERKENKTYFQVIDAYPNNDAQELFEEMQGEWKDFLGFIEF